MLHTLEPTRPHLHGRFSSVATPVLTVDSGDTVRFQTPDVSWGLEPPTSTTAPRRKVEPRDPIKDNGPCMCGPVALRGARAGDTLEISIERVRPAAWGWTYAGAGLATPAHNAALGIAESPLTLLRWNINHDHPPHGVATSHLGHAVPLRPFLGIIGLAPAEVDACAWTPRPCGGNMDCRELVAGSTLFLPIMVDGALLSVGDGHAAQGDGELSGTAIECTMDDVQLKLTLRRDMPITGPRIRTREGWVTLGFGETLDAAAGIAASAMLDLMIAQLHISRAEAAALASSRVDLRITQMVNPLKGVHAVLRD